MPYENAKSAKDAGFPTTIDEVKLTLGQINRLAKLYDAIKKSDNADEPMAVAIAQWKKEHHKSDDAWVSAETLGAEVFGADIPPSSYDSALHIVNAIKIGTVAHTSSGLPFECGAEWLENHAADWTGGRLIANHYGENSETYGNIVRSWWSDPFVKMELGGMNPETESRMENGDHTGFSFDAIGDPDDPANVMGTNLSILFYPHKPACPATDGCGITAEDELHSQNVEIEDIQKHIGYDTMAEGKPYTEAEIAKLVSDSAAGAAKLATFEAEAKTHESEVGALKAEIGERNTKISELTETAGEMFTAETVDAKVAEAKDTMFSAEDVETAKKEAIEIAIAAEKEKIDMIAAELAAITKMFPEGLAEDFKTELFAMVKDGKSHDALVKLGEIEYTTFKAQVPVGAGEPPKDDEIVAESGVGVYDPVTGTFKDVI